ncbi:hypothetical protein ACFPM0_25390 [Pseudonocardia sulfidoxydans]
MGGRPRRRRRTSARFPSAWSEVAAFAVTGGRRATGPPGAGVPTAFSRGP